MISNASQTPPDLAVTGSNGRIGQMLRRVWPGSGVTWLLRGADLGAGVAGRHAILALAGVTRGDEAALAANTVTAIDALEAAGEAGVARVLLMSSAAIYGRACGPLTENTAPTPASSYGTAKARMEAAVLDWCATHPGGPEATTLRLGNVAGADALLSRLGDTPPRLDIFEGGHGPRRSYIGPVTLAQTFTRLLAHPAPLPSILNVSAPGAVDMADLLRAAGRDWTPAAPAPDAIAQVSLDTTLLQSIAPLAQDAADPARIVAEWREVAA